MLNNLIFLASSAFIVGFAHLCLRQGQSVLFAWVALQSILANLFVLKQITLFGLNATASDMFAIGGMLGLTLLRAHFGSKVAKQAVWASFLCMIFVGVVSQAHLLYTPNDYDYTHAAYAVLFSPAPRILIASLTVFFLVQQFDIYFFGKMSAWLPHWSFTRLTTCCLLVSQAIDTVLFGFFALYGLVDAIWEIILMSFAIKVIVIFCMMPFSHLTEQLSTAKQ